MAGRPKLSDEERKQNRKEYNARYYQTNQAVRERNLEKSKMYYQNNKERINKRIVQYNKNMRAEFKRLKAIVNEQLETEDAVRESLHII